MDYKDYYGILGVARDADSEEIKRAYRKMARVYHPDVHPDKVVATERFKEINEAYTVLSDADKRRRYDQLASGYDQMRRTTYGSASTGRAYSGSTASAAPRSASSSQASASSSASDASQRRSAGSSSSAADTQRGYRRPYATMSEEDIERIFRGFGWAYSAARGRRAGGSADFSDFFETFFGSWWGSADENPDSTEFRPGRDLQTDIALSLDEAFSGAYRTVGLSDGRKVEVSIPAGVATGSRLRVRDQGERFFGRSRGHLYVNIAVKPHPQFAREGDNLRVKVSVPHRTATYAGEVRVPTPAKPVVLKIPAGTQTGQVFRLKEQGMPSLTPDKRRGDLLVEVTVLPEPPSGGPRPAARRSTNIGARVGAWLRTFFGLALVVTGLLAAVAVGLADGVPGWQLLAGFGAILAAHGLAMRTWAAPVGALVLGASVAFALWSGAEAASLAQYILPLAPLAIGYYLLVHRPPA